MSAKEKKKEHHMTDLRLFSKLFSDLLIIKTLSRERNLKIRVFVSYNIPMYLKVYNHEHSIDDERQLENFA